MRTDAKISRPSKEEQMAAMASYSALKETLKELNTETIEIEIEETKQKITIPLSALELLTKILEVTGKGQSLSIVPIAAEMTTQTAAEMLGCSRPHLVQLLENGEIPFTKVGKHRRVKYEDVQDYRQKMKVDQKKRIIQMMQGDEEIGLYDS